MYLSETHIFKQSNELDDITFKCKNLYNKANYTIRQEFINNGKYINKFDMFTKLKDDPDYKALPSRISRCVLRTLDGCKKCYYYIVGISKRKSLNDFIYESSKKHNSFYDYSLVDYISSHKKVTISCPIHGYFKQRPANHLIGQGCPVCKKVEVKHQLNHF